MYLLGRGAGDSRIEICEIGRVEGNLIVKFTFFFFCIVQCESFIIGEGEMSF